MGSKAIAIVGVLALAGLTVPASAADLGARPITKAPVAAPIAAYNWSGCYIGANAGGKWGKYSGDVTAGVFPAATVLGFDGTGGFDNNDFDSSFVGGGQIGCQWQSGAFVWGLEGDFDGTSVKQTFTAGVVPGFVVPAPFVAGDSIQFKNRWQASVRGRLGYAWDRWMVYATGGVAFADVKATLGLVGLGFFEDSQTLTGGTVGAGVEYGLTDNVSLGLEYRYTKFSSETFGGNTLAFFALPVTASTDLETHEVTARLNWRFNWGTPLGGRY
jgi:outer membrane immunogenic protein